LKQRKINKALIGRQAKEYLRINRGLKEVFKLYRDVFAVQKRISQKIPDQLPHLKGGEVSYRIEQGRLLIEVSELNLDLSVLREMLMALGEVLKKEDGGPLENLEKVLVDDEALRQLAGAFLEEKEDSGWSGMAGYAIEPEILYMLMHMAVAPFFWKKASTLARKADLGQVPQGTCPVCGDLPVMGLLREEDGLRILECSLCATRWGIPRMMCPFCRTTDQAKLSYIFAEGDQSRRAYLCENCKKYIKISAGGSQGMEDIVLPLEDLATVHLDHAAAERGYERGCRTVFS
jgi:FdhE protein